MMASNDLKRIIGLGSSSLRKNYYKDLAKNQYKLNQFRFALDSFTYPFVFFNPVDFKVIDCNKTYLELFDNAWSVPFSQHFDNPKHIRDSLKSNKYHIESEIITSKGRLPVELTIKRTCFQGNEIGICLIYDVSERKKYERELENKEKKFRSLFQYAELSRKQLQAVIDNSEMFAITIDHAGWVIQSNVSQFPFENKIDGKNIFSDEFPKEYSEFVSLLKETKSMQNSRLVSLKDVNGKKYSFNITAKKIGMAESFGYLIYGHDVTNYNEVIDSFVPGHCYMHLDEQKTSVCQALDAITTFDVFSFSRNPDHDRFSFPNIVKINASDNPLEDIYEHIKKIVDSKKAIIYFDRFDFLRCFSDFSGVMRMVYKINDLIRTTGSIIVYSVPNVFTDMEIEYFRNECFLITLDNKENLDPRKIELLRCLYASDVPLNCTQLGKKCDISRKTVLYWSNELEKMGFIEQMRHGRSKYLKLTVNGGKVLKNGQ
ncbi:MAG: MarR family transcriptional regulator [Nanobdellota archaeon]